MRFHFSWDEWKTRKFRWHRWFAWRPIEVDLCDGTWCWFCLIERKRVKDSEIGDYWDYREIGSDAEIIPPDSPITAGWIADRLPRQERKQFLNLVK